MNENSCPLVVLYGYQSAKDQLSFLGRDNIIVLTGRSKAIQGILRLCNGVSSVRDIATQLPKFNFDEVLYLLTLCHERGIVKDSRELYVEFHQDSANPSKFSYDLGSSDVGKIMSLPRVQGQDFELKTLPLQVKSNLSKLLEKRKSVRQFKRGYIPGGKISGLLQVMYSISRNGHWTVPSGGSLYPLDLYIIVKEKKQALTQGIYRWNPEQKIIALVSDTNPSVWLSKVFNAKSLLRNVPYIICIAADLRRPASKYSNRGYRNTLIEVGHVAQNAYLYCSEQNMGVLEYLGFCEKELAERLGLSFEEKPVISSLFLGIPDNTKNQRVTCDQEDIELAWLLRNTLVGKNKPITKINFWNPSVCGYKMPRWIAMAGYQPPKNQKNILMQRRCSAFSTGLTSSEAVIKCIAEGFERYAWEDYRVEIIESADNLQGQFLDPRIATPFSERQFKFLKGFIPFSTSEKIGWVSGRRQVDNELVWVPADLVFSTSKRPSESPQFFQSSSNGVAAHFDKDIAINNALYELVERDAFSAMWYSKREVPAVSHQSLSLELQNRIKSWEKLGYNVKILNITLDGPPVSLVIIWSHKKIPALASGAGSRETFLKATNRAFDEAEFMAVTWHNRRLKKSLTMSKIRSPDDHGLFYADPKNICHVDWLLNMKERDVPKGGFCGNFSIFDPVIVDITPKVNSSGLVVVRALSERLMPINFGYGTEHYRHPRLNKVELKWVREYPSIPHFFA